MDYEIDTTDLIREPDAENARGLIIAGRMGDLEISWDPEKDSQVRDLIAKKMAEGMRFFILKPVFGGRLAVRSAIKAPADLKANVVRITDGDVKRLFMAGDLNLFRTHGEIEGDRVARTADEAVQNRTVGVPALQGG